MPPIGYLLVTVGVFVLRQVMVGRALEIPSDARDLALALFSGDVANAGAVLSRRGENVPESAYGSGADSGTPSLGSSSLAGKVKALGDAAKGYRLGSTGPTYFDCSGLIWRAMRDLGIYDGPRFTTSTFQHVASKEGWVKIGSPIIGAIVLWPNHHMGISFGGDQMYSARSPDKGIGLSTISGDSSYFGSQPVYYQVATVQTSVTVPDNSPSGGGSW